MRLITISVVLAMLAVACGSTDATTTTTMDAVGEDSAAIYAVSLQQLVTEDNGFSGTSNPFTELLVQTSLDPGAGSGTPGDGEIRPLTAGERQAIEAALTPIAPVTWIDDPEEWRTEDLLPSVEGSAILGVGPITFDDDGALVPMSMWCGGLCGTWFTYRVIQADAGWAVSGIEGPIAVS